MVHGHRFNFLSITLVKLRNIPKIGGLTTIKSLFSRKTETTKVPNLIDLHHIRITPSWLRHLIRHVRKSFLQRLTRVQFSKLTVSITRWDHGLRLRVVRLRHCKTIVSDFLSSSVLISSYHFRLQAQDSVVELPVYMAAAAEERERGERERGERERGEREGGPGRAGRERPGREQRPGRAAGEGESGRPPRGGESELGESGPARGEPTGPGKSRPGPAWGEWHPEESGPTRGEPTEGEPVESGERREPARGRRRGGMRGPKAEREQGSTKKVPNIFELHHMLVKDAKMH
ncbi:hypothetical protein YC2023_048146 [Brassica napus]